MTGESMKCIDDCGESMKCIEGQRQQVPGQECWTMPLTIYELEVSTDFALEDTVSSSTVEEYVPTL